MLYLLRHLLLGFFRALLELLTHPELPQLHKWHLLHPMPQYKLCIFSRRSILPPLLGALPLLLRMQRPPVPKLPLFYLGVCKWPSLRLHFRITHSWNMFQRLRLHALYQSSRWIRWVRPMRFISFPGTPGQWTVLMSKWDSHKSHLLKFRRLRHSYSTKWVLAMPLLPHFRSLPKLPSEQWVLFVPKQVLTSRRPLCRYLRRWISNGLKRRRLWRWKPLRWRWL